MFYIHKSCMTRFNIIVPSTLMSATWFLRSRLRQKLWVHFSSWHCACSISTTSNADIASQGARGSGGGADRNVQNTKICCGFLLIDLRSSNEAIF
jgi:hypothetical protein